MVPQLVELRDGILRSSIALDFAVHLGGMKMYNDLRHQY